MVLDANMKGTSEHSFIINPNQSSRKNANTYNSAEAKVDYVYLYLFFLTWWFLYD